MAGLGEQLVVLGAAFARAGFGAVGAMGEEITGEGVEGAFEADAIEGRAVSRGSTVHEGADEIVGDEVHPELALDHVGAFAAEDVEAHGRLDVAKKELGAPPPPASTPSSSPPTSWTPTSRSSPISIDSDGRSSCSSDGSRKCSKPTALCR